MFYFMYEQLSPAQRQAEAARLNAAIEMDPRDETARGDARLWDRHVRAWNSDRRWQREKAQSQAISEAESALTRCTYLGGYPGFPECKQPCDAIISVGSRGGIAFGAHNGRAVCLIPWPEINHLSVLAIEQTHLGRHPRRRRSPFHIRQRHASAMTIITTRGDACFLVPRLAPRELQGKLAKLNDCIDQPAADAYDATHSGIRLELIRQTPGLG